MTHDDDLRDPELSALLRRELVREVAPRRWVEDALAVPGRATAIPETRTDPWLVVLAPHLGALFLIAMAVGALLDPAARDALVAHIPRFQSEKEPFLILAGLITPLLLVLCDRGLRGVSVLRRFQL